MCGVQYYTLTAVGNKKFRKLYLIGPVSFSSPLNFIARKKEISGGNLRSKEISCYVFATTFTQQ